MQLEASKWPPRGKGPTAELVEEKEPPLALGVDSDEPDASSEEPESEEEAGGDVCFTWPQLSRLGWTYVRASKFLGNSTKGLGIDSTYAYLRPGVASGTAGTGSSGPPDSEVRGRDLEWFVNSKDATDFARAWGVGRPRARVGALTEGPPSSQGGSP